MRFFILSLFFVNFAQAFVLEFPKGRGAKPSVQRPEPEAPAPAPAPAPVVPPVAHAAPAVSAPVHTQTAVPVLTPVSHQSLPKYGHAWHFGVRLTGTGSVYAGEVNNIANTKAANASIVKIPNTDTKTLPDYTKYVSAGWWVPLQLEGTYGVTDSFEVLLGVRYGFSDYFTGQDAYLMPSVGAALGYRYYFNVSEFIQPYLSSQIAMDLTQFIRGEASSAFGFLFDINPMIGIFVEGNMALAALYNADGAIGDGVQAAAGLSTGLHLHF